MVLLLFFVLDLQEFEVVRADFDGVVDFLVLLLHRQYLLLLIIPQLIKGLVVFLLQPLLLILNYLLLIKYLLLSLILLLLVALFEGGVEALPRLLVIIHNLELGVVGADQVGGVRGQTLESEAVVVHLLYLLALGTGIAIHDLLYHLLLHKMLERVPE